MATTITRPQGFWLVTIATAFYLVWELGFNAQLLDVAGTIPSKEALDQLEFFGRTLSGIGASLVLWRLYGNSKGGFAFGGFLLIAVITVPFVYWGQKALVDALVDKASPKERKYASYLNMASTATLRKAAMLKGLELSPNDYGSPSGKAFFALFPALAYLSPTLMTTLDGQLEPLARSAAEQQVGKPELVYNDYYVPMTNEIRAVYNKQYVPASNRTSAAAVDSQQAWNDYLEELERNHIDPAHCSEMTRIVVVQRLHKKHINVPSHWKLDDEKGFKAAIDTQHTFSRKSSAVLGFSSSLPPGLSWPAFASHTDVQTLVRKKLKEKIPALRVKPGLIDLDASFDKFATKIYAQGIADVAQENVKILRSADASFEVGGANYELGRRAMHAVLVPPLALLFSLFFGLTNFISLIVGVLPLRGRATIAVKGICYATVILAPLSLTNPVTESTAYQDLELSVSEHSALLAHGIRWVAQTAPFCYPATSRALGIMPQIGHVSQ